MQTASARKRGSRDTDQAKNQKTSPLFGQVKNSNHKVCLLCQFLQLPVKLFAAFISISFDEEFEIFVRISCEYHNCITLTELMENQVN